ncbi:M23 family metallopeptidase [Paraburkholderia sprentiae WSM5005]|uniref:M23 family metallopeptidase n=1 Tax=Paraburkholderia sprentiae WSM5005 TaxID=754502 RepID=A0A1I9YPG5_9BURK|nr:M23 family metallopeptidase [Paraburkholderia sprentiae]APA88198.1 M23 family metallopeptidase [Paraburkholderia sprentiae WSM5005]
MMRVSYLRHACCCARAISVTVGHSMNCRFTSSARAVLLCGIAALLGTSSAIRSSLTSEVIVPAVDEPVSKAGHSELSDAAPLRMPEADSGSYAGRIDGTLHDTLVRANVPMDIQEQIAHIFAHQLDLAAPAQKGDTYQVLYGRDDTTTARKRLTAVELRSRGQVYQAVWFIAPGHTDGDYYSFDGRRLTDKPFTMPLGHARVSSRFGYRHHPVKGKHLMHTGVDFAAPMGTSVAAAASGTVRFVGFRSGYGKIVELSHPRGYTTHYAHLSAFARDLRVGAPVTGGQPLGAVGSTGTATGAHLHFEVRKHDRPVDPLTLTSRTRAAPLTASQRIAFDSMTGALLERLAALPADTPPVRMASNAEGTANRAGNRKGSLV